MELSNLDSKSYYFGYFCVQVDGRERVLVSNGSGDWNFLISGFAEVNQPIQTAIDIAIKQFCNQTPFIKEAFLKCGFLQPQIFELELQDDDHDLSSIDGVTPNNLYFFKLELNTEVELDIGNFVWRDKHKILNTSQIETTESFANRNRLIRAIRSDLIQTQFGSKVLECVDILIFREHHGNHEFLMLYREKLGKETGGWEYPKGGLEYHETPYEGALRELLEETGVDTGVIRFGGYLGYQTSDVSWRGKKFYDTVRVHGLAFLFYGDDRDIRLSQGEGHVEYKWMSWEEARDRIWVGEYGKLFFDRWKAKRWEIIRQIARPISLAFQITEECPLGCKFCHRRQNGENDLTLQDWKDIVDVLASRGIIRLTITGGEPTLPKKKSDIFSVIRYAHDKKIHTSLSTTGFNLSEEDIDELEPFLDHILLSMHTIDSDIARSLYQSYKTWEFLKQKAKKVLEHTKNSKILVEICTTVSSINIYQIIALGEWLFNQNPKVLWRLDEYYENGDQSEAKHSFELSSEDFSMLKREVQSRFPKQFEDTRIRFNSKESRFSAPDFMITPSGNLVTTSKNTYVVKGQVKDLLFLELHNRKPWEDYRDSIRVDWAESI